MSLLTEIVNSLHACHNKQGLYRAFTLYKFGKYNLVWPATSANHDKTS